MTTLFSVNLNKLALLRNSRGSDYPNLIYFVGKLIELGVKGFTVHPRPDARHIKYNDVYAIGDYLKNHPEVEFNIEGNPNKPFLDLIKDIKPHQCTLVPDSIDQLTSDHGYNVINNQQYLTQLKSELDTYNSRCAVFIEPDYEQIQAVIDSNIETIEIYTEHWARMYANDGFNLVKDNFAACIGLANNAGVRVNAGHDLNLVNLAELLSLGDIAEVSIGHAFTIECIEYGMDTVVADYLAICNH